MKYKKQKNAFRYAMPRTIPVMVGYLFLGAAYGILMKVNGYGIGWILAMSVLVYAGSLQYVAVTLLVSAAHPLDAFVMALMINARHLFYGISMLERYRDIKKFRPYMIFALTDETFSVLCHIEVPPSLDKEWVYFWVALLDQFYWVTGSILGYLIGQAISFDTAGLDFALTALFVVIFVDQWKNQKDHSAALIGIAASILGIFLVGSDLFIIPAMVGMMIILTVKYQKEGHR